MISWTDLTPDFKHLPIGELSRHLSFTAVCSLMLGSSIEPRIVLSRGVRGVILQHLSERSVEMGGLLVGTVHLRSSAKDFVVSIDSSVQSTDYDGTSVSLRMGSDVWEAARAISRQGQSVVGWYHSHPNLGAFFSGTDRRTQKSFFHHPHCIGLVVDPIRHEEKWFIGVDSDELAPHQIILCERKRMNSTLDVPND